MALRNITIVNISDSVFLSNRAILKGGAVYMENC